MKRMVCVLLCLAAPWLAQAAESVDVEAIKQKILDELKPVIEAEVQRRVQEELAKQKGVAAPGPGAASGAAVEPAATTAWSPA